MPAYFVPTLFAVLSIVYLSLYARDRLWRRNATIATRKAWLRIGLIFGAVSLVLFYID